MDSDAFNSDRRESPVFLTTHWTMVLEAAQPEVVGGHEAFARLYEDYWYPLYAYVCRRGHTSEGAEDITQSFFHRLLQKESLAGLQREGGRFRSFLLSALGNFLSNEWDRAHAQKRGGGQTLIPLEIENGEARFALGQAGQETPESLFKKRWVFTLLEHVMQGLRDECARDGEEITRTVSSPGEVDEELRHLISVVGR